LNRIYNFFQINLCFSKYWWHRLANVLIHVSSIEELKDDIKTRHNGGSFVFILLWTKNTVGVL